MSTDTQKPVAWMTHHDEPMLFPTEREAQSYCDDDEHPIPLYVDPVAAQPDVTQQTLDDVMAGIPARDAEIAALRKENEQLRQAINRPVSAEPVAHAMEAIMGYRLEFKPGEYCYYTPEGYALEAYKGDAPAHALYANPQPGCPSEVEVYKGWCWVRPKYNSGNIVDETFRPLFLGPQLGAPVAAQAQHAISGYTHTVPDDCETLHWRGNILSMNELASVAQPAVGEEIHIHIEGQDVLTLPLASSGMDAPRFVVHVPAQAQPLPDSLIPTAPDLEYLRSATENSALPAFLRGQIAAAVKALAAQAQQPVSGADGLAIELQGIAEAIGNGGGFWRSCSGCHESNDGMATDPFSKTLKCHLGVGCSECGGIGAIWDTTDYNAMADFMAAKDQQNVENTETVVCLCNASQGQDADKVDAWRSDDVDMHAALSAEFSKHPQTKPVIGREALVLRCVRAAIDAARKEQA
ncbi:hypothetical protein MJ863_12620 [Alcaligenes ammonioxydans]|uniref:hypothetical protein n=1 Tax=Alcaligenes ammonioxydans TaxID=2582914 RepID=UPI001F056133|nr:hypothetical protein [Alcaligenes ammonioxydans]MCH1880427.1 hypothetical protein [Alcaligenes ammonioxydans]